MTSLFDSSKYGKFFVGYDKTFQQMQDFLNSVEKYPLMKSSSFPPYNIKKVDDNKYVIEMSLAGFGKNDIEIELDGDVLTVSGHYSNEEVEDYLHKGMSTKDFKRAFTVADTIEVKNASLTNGLLKIWLEAFVPEKNKPKKININEKETTDPQQFLSE